MVAHAFTRDDIEAAYLAPYAMRSADSAGRQHPETEHPYRGAFQRDRDRVVHSAAFRRLSGKTQVFTGGMGDYHRTRLTHTMEVASVARTIGRTLRLNEDLVEALALLHDIGHPPFGHAGEDALNECLVDDGGFSHNQFALTLVLDLERPYPHYRGLNLTREVLMSQEFRAAKHRVHAGDCPLLEAQVVDAADSMAYDAHDVDDAVKLGLLTVEELLELPLVAECHRRVIDRFGSLQGKMLRRTLVHELIDLQVSDLLKQSTAALEAAGFSSATDTLRGPLCICSSADIGHQKRELERFLFQKVYRHPAVIAGRSEAQRKLRDLFNLYCNDPARLPEKFQQRLEEVSVRRAVADYLGGMTDHFCLRQFEQLA
ncbi:MAG: dNTP triphosphohydrolase [Planctomycetales bacterium]|nr:dNTP triphosphohydrolase [Planctomycetales bacterium]